MLKTALIVLCAIILTVSICLYARRQTAPHPVPVHAGVSAAAEQDETAIVGQTVYVPVYSHIYFRDKRSSFNLTATLSIRNTDAANPITVTSARYFNGEGKLIHQYVKNKMRISPMAAAEFVIDENDTSGGSGASFVVEWSSGFHVTEPVIEAVMIGASGQQGISFVSTGRIIKSRGTQ